MTEQEGEVEQQQTEGGREEGRGEGRGGREGGRGEGRGGREGEGREGGEGRRFGGGKRRRRRARKSKEDELESWTPTTKLGRLVKGEKIKYLEEIYLHSLAVKEPEIIDFFLKDTLKDELESWTPSTKLGRLVKGEKIKYLEEIYLHSLAVKEPEIIDFFLKDTLKDEVMKIMPVQKQTRAGQRTKFKAIVAIGDHNGHVGLGLKCAKETAIAIRGAINMAKLSIIPVRRGYWGNKIGKPHTFPTKVAGKCGSVRVRVIPAPRGTGIVAAYVPTRLLLLAGIEDAFSKTKGNTKTLGNFARATFNALGLTYNYLTPDLWPEFVLTASPLEQHAKHLQELEEQKKVEELI